LKRIKDEPDKKNPSEVVHCMENIAIGPFGDNPEMSVTYIWSGGDGVKRPIHQFGCRHHIPDRISH
jgi:hypothetical protein